MIRTYFSMLVLASLSFSSITSSPIERRLQLATTLAKYCEQHDRKDRASYIKNTLSTMSERNLFDILVAVDVFAQHNAYSEDSIKLLHRSIIDQIVASSAVSETPESSLLDLLHEVDELAKEEIYSTDIIERLRRFVVKQLVTTSVEYRKIDTTNFDTVRNFALQTFKYMYAGGYSLESLLLTELYLYKRHEPLCNRMFSNAILTTPYVGPRGVLRIPSEPLPMRNIDRETPAIFAPAISNKKGQLTVLAYL